MATDHAQIAQRCLDQGYAEPGNENWHFEMAALTHAQLETASQIERLANLAERAAAGIDAIKSITQDTARGIDRFFAPDGEAAAIARQLGIMFRIFPPGDMN